MGPIGPIKSLPKTNNTFCLFPIHRNRENVLFVFSNVAYAVSQFSYEEYAQTSYRAVIDACVGIGVVLLEGVEGGAVVDDADMERLVPVERTCHGDEAVRVFAGIIDDVDDCLFQGQFHGAYLVFAEPCLPGMPRYFGDKAGQRLQCRRKFNAAKDVGLFCHPQGASSASASEEKILKMDLNPEIWKTSSTGP